MPTLKVLWTNVSHQQFNQLRQRAVDANHLSEFIMAHNEIVAILRDLDQATARGDPLYRTKKPGGVAYHFFHAPISLTYTIHADEGVCWIVKYLPVPTSWPEG